MTCCGENGLAAVFVEGSFWIFHSGDGILLRLDKLRCLETIGLLEILVISAFFWKHMCNASAAEGQDLKEKHAHGDPEPYLNQLSLLIGLIELLGDQIRVDVGVLVCTLVDDLEIVDKLDVFAVDFHFIAHAYSDNWRHDDVSAMAASMDKRQQEFDPHSDA